MLLFPGNSYITTHMQQVNHAAQLKNNQLSPLASLAPIYIHNNNMLKFILINLKIHETSFL